MENKEWIEGCRIVTIKMHHPSLEHTGLWPQVLQEGGHNPSARYVLVDEWAVPSAREMV